LKAVRKGRVLYAAIQKFIAFIMSLAGIDDPSIIRTGEQPVLINFCINDFKMPGVHHSSSF
jgi:hypothetical protein